MAELNNSGTGQWSETDANNTSASPDGWPSGTFFNQVEPIGRSTMGAIKRFWDRINSTVTTTGASGTYTYTPVNTSYPTAYKQGEKYSFKADKDSAGNDVININGLGAINIYKTTSLGVVQIGAGDIKTGAHITGDVDTALNAGSGGFLCTAGLAASTAATNPFSDATALVKNSSDATKQAIFSAASISTATTRTYTLPNASDTLVGKATTDTLTNKTYDTAGTGNTFKINGTTINAISGNTSKVATLTGATTSGHIATFDASGNIQDGGNSIPVKGSSLTLNPYATSATGSQAHGLSSTPTDVVAYLECISSEAGYAVGERVPMGGANCDFQGAGITISFDSSNIYYNTNTSDVPDIVNKSGFSRQGITPSKWKVVMTPVLF